MLPFGPKSCPPAILGFPSSHRHLVLVPWLPSGPRLHSGARQAMEAPSSFPRDSSNDH